MIWWTMEDKDVGRWRMQGKMPHFYVSLYFEDQADGLVGVLEGT